MSETPPKRPREETHDQEHELDTKRHKSYNHILSILDDHQDSIIEQAHDDDDHDHEPNYQDLLSSMLTTLQQELSCEPSTCQTTQTDPADNPAASDNNPPSLDLDGVVKREGEEEEEEERESVMRHLLEASDDELGIPNMGVDGDGDEINGGDHALAFFDGFWEFEDESANYYTMLQSELFM